MVPRVLAVHQQCQRCQSWSLGRTQVKSVMITYVHGRKRSRYPYTHTGVNHNDPRYVQRPSQGRRRQSQATQSVRRCARGRGSRFVRRGQQGRQSQQSRRPPVHTCVHDPRYEPVHTRACKPWHVHGRRGLDPRSVHERQVTIAVHTRASRYAAACLVRRINFPTLHLSPSLR